jgi:alpha-1,2-mannosyltransferase
LYAGITTTTFGLFISTRIICAPVGKALLWILAGASLLLLAYEGWTLIGFVLRPLLANPNALQTDFHYYYDAARRFTADRMRLYQLSDDVIAGFAYPPPAIVPFMWLARWPLGTALVAWTIISYLMILVSLQQWLKYLRANGHVIDRTTAIAAGLVAFAIGPTYMNAIFGQVNALVLASAVAFVRLAPLAAMEAGILLALGTWLKIYPAYLAVIGLWDRKTWKAIAWTIAFGIVIAVVFLPVVSLPSYRSFLFDVLARRFDKTAIQITNQSLVAFIERFRFAPDFYTYWTGQEAVTVSRLASAINLAFAAIATVSLAIVRIPQERKAATLMALIAVIAPLGWGHTYVMVLPLVMLSLITMRDASTIVAVITALCVLAFMVPSGRRLPIDFMPGWLENIVYSRYLLATLLLMLISSNRVVGQKTESTVIASA